MSTRRIAPTAVRDLAEAREIDDPWIGAAAGNDQLGLVLLGQPRQLRIIDALVLATYAIRDYVIRLAGKIQRMAMRQVPAVRQVHAQNHVARLDHRRIRRLVGLRSRVRLHIHVLGAEKLLGPVARQRLHRIGEFASSVIALARDIPRHICW